MDWRWYMLGLMLLIAYLIINWAFKLPPDDSLDKINEELKKEIEQEKQQELKNKQ